MPTEEELFAAVDALLEGEPQLPSPAERARLREAAGVTQARLAQVLRTTPQTVKNWEHGRSEPRPPRLQAYLRLLEGWAAQHPAPSESAGPAVPTQAPEPNGPAPESPGPAPESDEPATAAPAPDATAPAPSPAEAPPVPVPTTAPAPRPSTARRPAPVQAAATKRATSTKPAPAETDPRFAHGPLAVLDGDGSAYCVGGLVLDCPAGTLPALVEWALTEAKLGAARLHRHGQDADPLIVLTDTAAERLGLPAVLEDRRGLRLAEDHKVVKQLAKAKWKLTRRGFGPWARVYRPAERGKRQCVQFAVLPWGALDTRSWGDTAQLPAPDIAAVLGTYATRVLTPRGSTAVCGLELMTALRPPTRAVKDPATGSWVSGPNPGSLTEPVDPAPPEAPAEHPLV
ncbi:helix-turn-helix domain-containing protein, partial [Streptomyces angustmyceticus]